ncbi:MAG: cytochrome ubiquinol oxidase subunit I [Planctomycetes bacterium]|nr:cytochrome ubiquinol oxidase subunit I [Planctomycetota bacterium]
MTLLVLLTAAIEPALAQDASAEGPEEYRSLPGAVGRWVDNRTAVWVAMQLHLMFGAFVLGVPIFALIVEVVGMTTGDARFDRLSKEFVKLLSAAFSTTAALGGLSAFLLVGLYPKFTQHWSSIFHKSFYVYGLSFFGEAFSLYLYYYSWDRLKGAARSKLSGALSSLLLWGSLLLLLFLLAVSLVAPQWVDSMKEHPGSWLFGLMAVFGVGQVVVWGACGSRNLGSLKMAHLGLGVLLNFFGIFLMVLANSWATHMMAPSGVSPLGELDPKLWDPQTKKWLGTLWQALHNPLWAPVNIHRLIANVTFGGFIVGAYAAIKFLTSKTDAERSHYDWMGYVGNFIGIASFIPLPFAGYYLGREVYGANPNMGLLMMGGGFSWAFIIQAVLIGIIFIGGNYYLWMGMQRIEGAERYAGFIKFINVVLFICFAIWLTPHNLPLSGEERALIGEQYHKFSSWFGVMVAKNAAVQFIILSTFFSFLLYRRGNKSDPLPFREQGVVGYVTLTLVGALCIFLLGRYLMGLGLEQVKTDDEIRFMKHLKTLLGVQIGAIVAAVGITFANRGKAAQALLFAVTIYSAVVHLSAVIGFEVMAKANPLLRVVSVTQVLLVISCLISVTFIDIFLFRKAKSVGGIRWGQMPVRSQYVLLLLCITIVLLMGLMGFIRSGLRENWHTIYILRDTSATAFTPTYTYMAKVVALIVFIFLALVSFVFWLAGLGEHGDDAEAAPGPGAGRMDAAPPSGGTSA